MSEAKTFTTLGLNRAYDLELIDDEICDLYMEAHRYALPGDISPKRDFLKRDLGKIINMLHEWREKYDDADSLPRVDLDKFGGQR
jgi:hypothetical protein